MDEDSPVLMLREERTSQEMPAITKATIELKNEARKGVSHPMEDSIKKIKTVKLVNLAKKIKTVKSVSLAKKIMTIKPVTPAKNIVYVPIESISASISILVKSVCDSILVESDLVKFIESIRSIKYVENSFPYNMISNSAYLQALNVFISKIGKETLNNKELKQGHLEPIKEET